MHWIANPETYKGPEVQILSVELLKTRGEKKMNKTDKIAIMKDRYNKLKNKKINEKCSGVLRKLTRQLRSLNALD